MNTEYDIRGATESKNFIIRVNSNLQVVVGADGSVAFGPGVNAEGAAVAFWNAVSDHARAARTNNDAELRSIAEALRKVGADNLAERILSVVEGKNNV